MAHKPKKLIIIDGHSNVFKAYHAIRDTLTNSKGEPTSAIYGFANMFFRLMKKLDFEHVVVVFDPPGDSFRKEDYQEYKANRPPTPPDLIEQDKKIRVMLEHMKVPTIEIDKYEADDVMASLAVKAKEDGEALICSSDKDMLQIVQPGIMVYREHLQKTELLDEKGVFEKLGVQPNQVAAYLGLMGDKADNIPGVPGVGKKGAAKLLTEFGDLDGILENATNVKGKKLSENLQTYADDARLSLQLATLKTDLIENFNWEDYKWSYQPSNELREFFQEMDFNNFIAEMGGADVAERVVDYSIVDTKAKFDKALKEIEKAELLAIDTETSGLDPFYAELVGISISWKKDQAIYIPLGHHEGSKQLSKEEVLKGLGPFLSSKHSKTWIAHNWLFDWKILKAYGFDDISVGGDTLLEGYLINPDSTGSLRLKDLSLSKLGIKMTEISELIGENDDLVTMSSVSIEDTANYAAQDADCTKQLHEKLYREIEKGELNYVYHSIEVPLIEVLASMELEGVRIDKEHFKKLSIEADEELQNLTDKIYEIAGRKFKINSPKQVGEVLFNEIGLTPTKKGKSGSYSTDVSVLEALKSEHPLPEALLEYRQIDKLRSTYIEPLPNLVHAKTGRVHTSYQQAVTATGRLSSSNPNLQNIPVRTEHGRKIREGFVPRNKDWLFVAADYSQIELRILAHLSGDKTLLEAFNSGADIHTLAASRIFKISENEVSKEMRNQAKAINFGIIYGMSDYRLARDQGISRTEAKSFIEEYFTVYSGVKDFIESTKETVKKTGFVRTLTGRRRFIPNINARNFNQRSMAERIAVNTPIQGTSADMIKLAMIKVHQRLQSEKLKAKMVLQVHDELIFDAPIEEKEQVSLLVKEEMLSALPLDVPLEVDVSTGENWAVAK